MSDHDPFAGSEPRDEPFRAERWKRAGATPEELESLEAAHDEMPQDVKAAEGSAIDRASDGALAQHLGAHRMTEEHPASELGGFLVTRPAPRVEQRPFDAREEAEARAQAEITAAHGEWKPRAPLNIDGTMHKAWNLAGGYVGILVGDAKHGLHVLAEDVDAAVAKVRQLVAQDAAVATGGPDVKAWQAAKHRADAAARIKR